MWSSARSSRTPGTRRSAPASSRWGSQLSFIGGAVPLTAGRSDGLDPPSFDAPHSPWANTVEGSAKKGAREVRRYLDIAVGSAAEIRGRLSQTRIPTGSGGPAHLGTLHLDAQRHST